MVSIIFSVIEIMFIIQVLGQVQCLLISEPIPCDPRDCIPVACVSAYCDS